jgi:hypothetical protein
MTQDGHASVDGGLRGPARSVLREIDRELDRINQQERALASQRKLLLSARAALTKNGRPERDLRRSITQREITAYLRECPGCTATQIAKALQADATAVSNKLHHGKHTRYVSNGDRWYLRPGSG